MKMKKWLAVSTMAVMLAAGTMSVNADSMTLSGGEVLDMGSSISVYPGERSFLGSQFHDWLLRSDAASTVEQALESANLFPKDKGYEKEMAEMAVGILRTGKVYQVRVSANDTFYQGMVLSLAVSDNDMLKIAMAGSAALDKDGKTGALTGNERKEAADLALAALRGTVEVEEHSSWSDRVSRQGLVYRTADAKVAVTRNGFLLPLYVKGVITRGEGKTVYTAFVSDQASGNYFRPFLDKALKEAKK